MRSDETKVPPRWVRLTTTGRSEMVIPDRPPLTPDEILALPYGARVVVQGGRVITIEGAAARLCVLLDFYARGVWLADPLPPAPERADG